MILAEDRTSRGLTLYQKSRVNLIFQKNCLVLETVYLFRKTSFSSMLCLVENTEMYRMFRLNVEQKGANRHYFIFINCDVVRHEPEIQFTDLNC